MVINRPPYLPSRDLNTEALRIGVPLDTKKALADAARRQGTSVSGIVRDAVREVIERDSAALQNPVPGAR